MPQPPPQPSVQNTHTQNRRRVVTIIGAGLVGSLAAIYFGARDWDVHVFERRADLRTIPDSHERSINLALSTRGLAALNEHLASYMERNSFTKTFVPMKARMIHQDSKITSKPYGLNGKSINAVDRKKLNEMLLDAAAEYKDRIMFHFMHEMKSCNLDERTCIFVNLRGEEAGETVEITSDLILGADGAYSSVRREVMKKTRMNFAQEYVKHGYVELTIPPKSPADDVPGKPAMEMPVTNGPFGDVFKMDPNHLHIWPKKKYMLIALPNPDGAFTCTLFMPYELLDTIQKPEDLVRLFEKDFPDALELMGKDLLVSEFFRNPKPPLISIKCRPYHYADSALFIGDAAHAMVPFYGQGVNAGFEDVQVLFRLFDKYDVKSEVSNMNSGWFSEVRNKVFGSMQRVRTNSTRDKTGSSSDEEKSANVDGEDDDAHSKLLSEMKRKRREGGRKRAQSDVDDSDFRQRLARVLYEFTETRHKDAVAICDLAMYNYIEMSTSVVSPMFALRQRVEAFLHRLFPSNIIPLYTMVSFSQRPYSECLARWQWQTRLLQTLSLVGGVTGVVLASILSWSLAKRGGVLRRLAREVLGWSGDFLRRIQTN